MKKNFKKLELISFGLATFFSAVILNISSVYAETEEVMASGQVTPVIESSLHKGAMKPVADLGQNGPSGFLWADFGTHAVLMTVIMGKPKGDEFPITILDAHIVSDQGTQHIESEVDKAAVAQLLVDGKKAKGTLMIYGANFTS